MQTFVPPAPPAGASQPVTGLGRAAAPAPHALLAGAMVVRVAERSDLQGLHALVNGAYRGESARLGWTHEADLFYGERTDLGALLKILADRRQAILVAGDGEPAGCVHVADAGGGCGYLGMLTVDPERQAGGLGRRLIAAAEEHAFEAFGARRMELTVLKQRPELVSYYERRGYRLTGAEAPFPTSDARFGMPTRRDLAFVTLAKELGASRPAS